MLKWLRHPLEALRWWLHGYGEPDWRSRLLKPFLLIAKEPTIATYQVGDVLETWEYRWMDAAGEKKLLKAGWEAAGIHPIHDLPGRKARLMRRRIK